VAGPEVTEARGAALGPAVRVDRGVAVRAVVIVALVVFVFVALPSLLSIYWIGILTATAIYTIVALGLNVLFGRVGLVSLGQAALLAIGAWIAARFFFLTGLPFPVVLLVAGLLTGVIGVVVGLPALRLSGLDLALITLMLAGAISIVLTQINFPNGGSGVLGHTEASTGTAAIRRPGIAGSDPAYYRYVVIVTAIMFLLALAHVASKAGRAWAAIRQSEPAAIAAGVNVTLYKLWAFALASFMTGVSGGLLAAYSGHLYPISVGLPIDSLTLLAVVLMGGIYSLWGAVVAGLLAQLLPAILNSFSVDPSWATILFGIGVLQVLSTAPEGIVHQLPRDLGRLGLLLFRTGRRVVAGGRAA
jgi:branched-chain amino acid transport system permease protein